MRTKRSVTRRIAAALALAVGVLGASGPAGAAVKVTSLPGEEFRPYVNASSDTQALSIRLTIPAAGIDISQAVSLAHGEVQYSDDAQLLKEFLSPARGNSDARGNPIVAPKAADFAKSPLAKRTADKASAWASQLQGIATVPAALQSTVDSALKSLPQPAGVSFTRANDKAGCTPSTNDSSAQKVGLPIGEVAIGAANSSTACKSSIFEMHGDTALTKVNLNLASLIGAGQPLAAVGDALRSLTDTINAQVLPTVNTQIDTAVGQLNGVLPQSVKDELQDTVTVGRINPIPDLSKVSLLNLTVLGSTADIEPLTKGGRTSLVASNSSKVTDISALGGWATIGVVGLNTSTYANGIKGMGFAKADVEVTGANLGGLLGLHLPSQRIRDLANIENLKKQVNQNTPAELKPVADQLNAAIDVLATIAGISVDVLGTSTTKNPKNTAEATAGTLTLKIEPKIPTADALTALQSGNLSALTADKFQSAGVALEVTFPKASSRVVVQGVLGEAFARTGLPWHWMGALILLGGAVMVRRFALSK